MTILHRLTELIKIRNLKTFNIITHFVNNSYNWNYACAFVRKYITTHTKYVSTPLFNIIFEFHQKTHLAHTFETIPESV